MDDIITFLTTLLDIQRVSRKEICQVELTSSSGEIIYSERGTPVGQISLVAKSVIMNKVPVYADNQDDSSNMYYYQPIVLNHSVQYVLITFGAFETIRSFSEAICESMEAFCAFNDSRVQLIII